MTGSFRSPKRLCKWAKENIAKFQELEIAFVASKPYKIETKDASLNGNLVSRSYNARFTKEVFEELSEKAFRIVGDLRSALDHSTSAASKIINPAVSGKTNFPFGDTERYVKRQLESANGPFASIPVQLHAKLLSFEPYGTKEDGTNGNVWLYALNKIANPNKHEQIIEAEVTAQGIGFSHFMGGDLEMGFHKISDGYFHLFKIFPTSPKAKVAFNLLPALRLVGDGPLSQQPAADTFLQLLEIVENIVSEIERETANITE